jgi:hypothetical protein
MGGKPCIHGMRVTVGMIVGMLAEGHSTTEILKLYPYLETEDIAQALSYGPPVWCGGSWRNSAIGRRTATRRTHHY